MKISKQQREDNTKRCQLLMLDNDFAAFSQLVADASVNANGANLMVSAILANKPRFVEAMLPFFSAQAHASHCVRKAIKYRHYECLKRLCSVAPQYVLSEQLMQSILHTKNMECINAMLPHYDPQSDEGSVLAAAVFAGNTEVIDLLFPISPVEISLDYKNQPGGVRLLELTAQQDLKRKMLNEITPAHHSSNKKM